MPRFRGTSTSTPECLCIIVKNGGLANFRAAYRAASPSDTVFNASDVAHIPGIRRSHCGWLPERLGFTLPGLNELFNILNELFNIDVYYLSDDNRTASPTFGHSRTISSNWNTAMLGATSPIEMVFLFKWCNTKRKEFSLLPVHANDALSRSAINKATSALFQCQQVEHECRHTCCCTVVVFCIQPNGRTSSPVETTAMHTH